MGPKLKTQNSKLKTERLVLVVGSVALDDVKTPFGEVTDALGGSAVYASVSAGFFAPVSLVGVVGKDFPVQHLKFLKQRGIDTKGLTIQDGNTFRWKGYYEYDLNQAHTRELDLGVFQTFQPLLPEDFRLTPFVFLAAIDPELQLEVLKQTSGCKFSVADTRDFWIETKKSHVEKVFKKAHLVSLNDGEARQFAGTHSLILAAKKILKLGPRAVVIKKGEHGSLLFTKIGNRKVDLFSIPAFPLEEVKDPTGAGDCFAGGLIGYLASCKKMNHENLRRAIVLGTVIASFTVEDFSLNRLKAVRINHIRRRYAQFHRIAAFTPWG